MSEGQEALQAGSDAAYTHTDTRTVAAPSGLRVCVYCEDAARSAHFVIT